MKNNRQSMILDIIAKEHIETQEQLLLELKRRGVDIPTDALTPEACAQLLRQRIARS